MFKVCKFVHCHTIQINQPTTCNSFSSLLLDVYLQLNTFWVSSCPSSGAQQLQWQPLVLPSERGDSSAVGRGWAGWPAQPRPTSIVYYLTFIYSSTCFGRPHAHRQELNDCSSSLWFYLRSVAIAVMLVVVGPTGQPDHDQQHRYHHARKVKPKAATAVVELLTMGVRTPETCWAVNKRQVINWRNCCI
jgi:hypothetical protein